MQKKGSRKSVPKKTTRRERRSAKDEGMEQRTPKLHIFEDHIGFIDDSPAKGFIDDSPAKATKVTNSTLRLGPDTATREMVNHPEHYGGDTEHEVIKCLRAWGLEEDSMLWNAVKYIARSSKKGKQIEDLAKARFYLDQRIATLRARNKPMP